MFQSCRGVAEHLLHAEFSHAEIYSIGHDSGHAHCSCETSESVVNIGMYSLQVQAVSDLTSDSDWIFICQQLTRICTRMPAKVFDESLRTRQHIRLFVKRWSC